MNLFGLSKLRVTARFRQAHNLKVVGSNPTPKTNYIILYQTPSRLKMRRNIDSSNH